VFSEYVTDFILEPFIIKQFPKASEIVPYLLKSVANNLRTSALASVQEAP
jgi:hypothetical protein